MSCAGTLTEAGNIQVVIQNFLPLANYQLAADTSIHLSDKMADETNRVVVIFALRRLISALVNRSRSFRIPILSSDRSSDISHMLPIGAADPRRNGYAIGL